MSKIGGMGAMIVRVKVTRPNGAKEWGYLCDPNAAWLKKENRDEGTVRIFSTTMLKRMGVIFRMEEYNDLDMLVCKRSGNMIDRPTDCSPAGRPTDQPTDRPTDRPTDLPIY